MTARQYTIIHGKDLANYMKKYDPTLAPKIDPMGMNVVYFSMIHNDVEMRAMMLVKLIGDPKPLEAKIDFPLDVWSKITQSVWDDGRETSNAPSN